MSPHPASVLQDAEIIPEPFFRNFAISTRIGNTPYAQRYVAAATSASSFVRCCGEQSRFTRFLSERSLRGQRLDILDARDVGDSPATDLGQDQHRVAYHALSRFAIILRHPDLIFE